MSRAFFLGLCFRAFLSQWRLLSLCLWLPGLGVLMDSACLCCRFSRLIGQGWEEGTGEVGCFNTSPPRVRADGGRAVRSRPTSGKTLRKTESPKSGEKWSSRFLETSKGSQLFSSRFKSLKGIPGPGSDGGLGILMGSGLSPSSL